MKLVQPGVTSRGGGVLRRHAGWTVLAIALIALVGVPLAAVQWRALQDGGSGYGRMWRATSFSDTLLTTLYLGVGSVAIAMTMGTLLAWSAQHLEGRLRWLSVAPMVPIMMPALAIVTGWSFLLSPRIGYANRVLRHLPWWSHLETGPIDIYSQTWIIIITGTLLISFVYLFVLTALRGIDAGLIEAAQVGGASSWRTFRQVQLPLLRPALVHSSALVLLLGLGQFTAPLLLGRNNNVNVLTTEMYRATQSYPIDYALGAAFGSPLIIVGVILIWLQRRSLADSTRFQSIGTKGHRTGNRQARWPIAIVALYLIIMIVLPIAALANVALQNFYTGKIVSPSDATLQNVRTVLGSGDTQSALRNTIVYSLVATLILLPFSYLIATGLTIGRRVSRPVRWLLDVFTSVPLVMPGVLFGAGILFAYTTGPIQLYGTAAALVLAYVTLMIPHATRLISSGLTSAGSALADAGRVHGGSAFRVHTRIVMPLVRPSLAGAAAITLAIVTHEFGASVMVRSVRTEVMGTLLLRYWSQGSYPAVAVNALLMCVLTTVMVSLALAFGTRHRLRKCQPAPTTGTAS
ncbi:MAG: iron ABC transporter permease [Ilumatobacteraceae bacterium]